MSQLIHVEVVKLRESEGSKVVYKVMMTMHLQASLKRAKVAIQRHLVLQ